MTMVANDLTSLTNFLFQNLRVRRVSRLCSHIHQLVTLKHRAIEVSATVVVFHPTHRRGGTISGQAGNHGAQRQGLAASRWRSRSRRWCSCRCSRGLRRASCSCIRRRHAAADDHTAANGTASNTQDRMCFWYQLELPRKSRLGFRWRIEYEQEPHRNTKHRSFK